MIKSLIHQRNEAQTRFEEKINKKIAEAMDQHRSFIEIREYADYSTLPSNFVNELEGKGYNVRVTSEYIDEPIYVYRDVIAIRWD